MMRSMMASAMLLSFVAAGVRSEDATKKAPTNEAFEKMKKLVGTWVEADKDGKPTDKVVTTYKLTAGGSAIHETNFPGQDMEMVSVYTVDKGNLIMTHYCVLGNQPRMKADPKSAKNTIHFAFDGGSNIDVTKDMHMHEATLTFVDDDHIELAGVAWVDGKPAENHCAQMKLVRKK